MNILMDEVVRNVLRIRRIRLSDVAVNSLVARAQGLPDDERAIAFLTRAIDDLVRLKSEQAAA